NFQIEDAVAHVVKAGISHEVTSFNNASGIEDEDFVAARQECVRQVRAHKAAAAGDQYLHVNRSPLCTSYFLAHSRAAHSSAPCACTRSNSRTPSPVCTITVGETESTAPEDAEGGVASKGAAAHTWSGRSCHVVKAPGYG